MGCDLWVEGVSGLWTPAVVRQTEGDMTLNKCIYLVATVDIIYAIIYCQYETSQMWITGVR